MKKTKKALATLAIAGMTLSMIPFNVFAASPVPTRIAGVTAEQTAVQIAEQTGYTGKAILASSTSYGMVDALTAGPLAASLQAPILLTGAGNTLNASTKAELTKLAVKTVYVTSGTAVIKQGVIDELKAMGMEVIELGGFDRAETSVNIAKKMTGVTKVAIANTVPDALSIASIAAAANQPILLTNKNALPSSVASYLASAGVTTSDVIGGTGVISDAVVAALPGATRHFGMTAYDTNNQVIQDFAASIEFDNVYVANGQTGIDALAGAPLAAQTKSAIVLTDSKSVPAAAAFTYSKSPVGAVVTALGGTAVVPEGIRVGVAAGQVTPVSSELKIVSVSSLTDDGRYLEVKFSNAVTSLNKSQVSVANSKTLARVGVEAVELGFDGKSATITMYEKDASTGANPKDEIERLTDYTVTVVADGKVVSFTFQRPGYTEGRITDVNIEKRTFTAGGRTINVPKTAKFDFQASLGSDIRVWFNKDLDLMNVVVDDSTVVTDGLEVTKTDGAENGKVEITAGVEYTLADTFTFYLNDAVAAIGAKGVEYDYAKLFFDSNGDVEFILAYNWDTVNPFVVKEMDADVAISYDNTELDLEDFIIMKDGKTITTADLKEGDMVYYSQASNGGDGVAEVYNNSVSGEITAVYFDKIKVSGKNYTYLGVTQYLDGDDFKAVDSDAAEEFQAGGDVKLYLNRLGDVVFMSGTQGVVDTNTLTAHLIDGAVYYADGVSTRGKVELDLVDEKGDEHSYSFRIDTLDMITSPAGTEYEVGKNLYGVEIEKFGVIIATGQVVALDSNGDVIKADGTTSATWTDGYPIVDLDLVAADNMLINVSTNDSGSVKELEFFAAAKTLDVSGANPNLELDDTYALATDGNKYRLQSDTLVFDGSDGFSGTYKPDADDITVSKWADLKNAGYEITDADIYVDSDGNVDYLVVKQTTADDTSDINAVITAVLKNTDNKVIEITVLIDGKEVTYAVDKVTSSASIAKGKSVIITVNDNSDLVEAIATTTLVSGVVDVAGINVTDKKISVGGTWYTLVSGADVYDALDTSDVVIEQFRDIKAGDTVSLLLDEVGTTFVEVITITARP